MLMKFTSIRAFRVFVVCWVFANLNMVSCAPVELPPAQAPAGAGGGARAGLVSETARMPMPPTARSASILNVREHGVNGDGVTDDTAALNALHPQIRKSSIHDNGTMYFPEGVYLVSDTVLMGLKRLIIRGDGPGKSIIRLKPGSPGFGDVDKPKVVLAYHVADIHGGNMGQAFGNSLSDISIEVGAGNPGAVGVNYICNNHGVISNVRIRSLDPGRSGAWGLGLTRNWPGPGLIRNLEVDGFDVGIFSTVSQYSMTFEHILLRNQRRVGLENSAQQLRFRNLVIDGAPVGIQHTGGNLVLLDGQIRSEKGETGMILGADTYLRNVSV